MKPSNPLKGIYLYGSPILFRNRSLPLYDLRNIQPTPSEAKVN
jgi:hypothetical protein